jgi:hypothetical protein
LIDLFGLKTLENPEPESRLGTAKLAILKVVGKIQDRD